MNNVYRNMENMTVMSITKRVEIIMSIQVYLIPQINLDYKENGGKKSFSCKSKAPNIVQPNVEDIIVALIIKRMEIIMSIQVCLISWMNFDYKENGGKKSFSCKSKS